MEADMTAESSSYPSQSEFRRLVLWNRSLISVLVALGFAWMGAGFLQLIRNEVKTVETSWKRDRQEQAVLRISSMMGYRLITHLSAVSDGTLVGASLPEPIFLLDSEGASIDLSTFNRLHWHNEGGSEEEAPKIGTPVRALYVDLSASTWKPSAPQ